MQQLEQLIWNMSPMPIHHTYTTVQNGGITLGAYDVDQMIGFLYSFPGFDGQNHFLCSHMLGLLPSYRKIGLGEKMKQKQANLARQAGYPTITWTFDPLESVNAYVNIHKLGAIGDAYRADHYGELSDDLNQGLPTDRMIIKWELTSEIRKQQPAKSQERRSLVTIDENKLPIQSSHDDLVRLDLNSMYTVSIPDDFQTIKSEDIQMARKWRMQTRTVFQALFSQEFKAVDLRRDSDQNQIDYVFAQIKKEDY